MSSIQKIFCTFCSNFQNRHFGLHANFTNFLNGQHFVPKRYFRFSGQSKFLWEVENVNNLEPKPKPFPILALDSDKSEKFDRNKSQYLLKEKEYEQVLNLASMGGGEKAIQRHVIKQKKMLVNDRIKGLLDCDTRFLELSVIGGMGMKYGDVPRTGIVTGIGKVCGKYCMIIANDATVKGGSVYPITLKKQLRAQEIAQQNGLPCFYIVESGGAFLPLQAEIFNPGGQTFYNEAIMSSLNIPQLAIVCGSCTAGGAYIPTMAQEAVIVHKSGTIFLGGPPLVKAALGEIVTAEELGGATLHCSTSGYTDYFAENEKEALRMGRDIMESLNIDDKSSNRRQKDVIEPQYDISDIPGLISEDNDIDIYQVIARIVDDSRYHEFKKMYGTTLKCGFSYLNGYLVGIIGNQGQVTEEAALKGSHFVQLCSERDIPLIFLQNTPLTDEHSLGLESYGLLKAQGKLMAAVSCSTVPKITVKIGNAYGSTHYMMGGKCMSPNFIFSWPNSALGLMNPEILAQELLKEKANQLETDKFHSLKIETKCKLNKKMTAISTSANLLDDGIIKPQDTRKVLGECLQIVHAYLPQTTTTEYPVFRM